MSTQDLVHHMRLSGLFSDPASVDFIEKVMRGAGFAPSSAFALSPGILKMKTPSSSSSKREGDPPPTTPNHDDAVLESEEIIFSVVDDLLLKTGLRAEEVDVVVTTCSCFAPVPSLAASVVNRFGMRADVLTASLVRSFLLFFDFKGGGGGRGPKATRKIQKIRSTENSLSFSLTLTPRKKKKKNRPAPAAEGTSSPST